MEQLVSQRLKATALLTLFFLAMCGGVGFSSYAEAQEGSSEKAVENFEPFTARVIGNRVRMRLGPSLESPIVRELDRGELFLVVGEANGFYSIAPPRDQKAYIYRTYLIDGRVEGSHVNVRLAPDLEAPILTQLNSGDRIEGARLSPQSRWVEINPPVGAVFYVARSLLERAGSASYLTQQEKRSQEVSRLLNQAYLTSQEELRKPFQEIDMTQVEKAFLPLQKDFEDYPEYQERAEKIRRLARDIYLQKKIAYLESRSQSSSADWAHKSAQLSAELESYQAELMAFQSTLEEEEEEGEALFIHELFADADSFSEEEEECSFALLDPLTSLSLESWLEGASQEVEALPPLEEESAPPVLVEHEPAKKLALPSLTDKMRSWLSAEESLFAAWQAEHGEESLDHFYDDQAFEAMTLRGIIEPYNSGVVNRPGDYLIRAGGKRAFLYSTKVNLDAYLGQEVEVTLLERPNHHFAYPAYFVLEADELE